MAAGYADPCICDTRDHKKNYQLDFVDLSLLVSAIGGEDVCVISFRPVKRQSCLAVLSSIPNDAIHLPRPWESMQPANNRSIRVLRAGDRWCSKELAKAGCSDLQLAPKSQKGLLSEDNFEDEQWRTAISAIVHWLIIVKLRFAVRTAALYFAQMETAMAHLVLGVREAIAKHAEHLIP